MVLRMKQSIASGGAHPQLGRPSHGAVPWLVWDPQNADKRAVRVLAQTAYWAKEGAATRLHRAGQSLRCARLPDTV